MIIFTTFVYFVNLSVATVEKDRSKQEHLQDGYLIWNGHLFFVCSVSSVSPNAF